MYRLIDRAGIPIVWSRCFSAGSGIHCVCSWVVVHLEQVYFPPHTCLLVFLHVSIVQLYNLLMPRPPVIFSCHFKELVTWESRRAQYIDGSPHSTVYLASVWYLQGQQTLLQPGSNFPQTRRLLQGRNCLWIAPTPQALGTTTCTGTRTTSTSLRFWRTPTVKDSIKLVKLIADTPRIMRKGSLTFALTCTARNFACKIMCTCMQILSLTR